MKATYLLAALIAVSPLVAESWPQYRGPGGTGISGTTGLPAEVGEGKNLVWKTALPPGHSSPVLTEGLIYLTAHEDERLYVYCLQRADGEIQWRREVPRQRKEDFNKTHGPASPSPVTDGENVYAFFGDYGLVSFDSAGNERWSKPMGPFQNINGHGSSPIISGEMLIVLVDQNADSYLLALDKDSGKQLWKTDRSETTRGYGTPGIFYPSNGDPQIVVPGAYRIISYDLATGRKLWWVNGMAWQLKCVPLFRGDVIFINAWEVGGDPGEQKETLSFAAVVAEHDADGDGKLSKTEVPDERLAGDRAWLEHDLDGDNLINKRDWDFYAARRAPINPLVAIKPDRREGDITDTGVLWRYTRSLPNTPSPLLLDDIIYMVKDGGIFQSIDTAAGEAHKLARLGPQSLEKYWASPVYADGKIYTVNQLCTVTTVEPGKDWAVIAASALDDDQCFATPAIADGRIYLRSGQSLYAFGAK